MSKKKSTKKPGKKPKAPATSPIDLALLQQLIGLMSANDLNTLQVRDGNRRVVLKRGSMLAPNASSGFVAPQNQNSGLASGATNSAAADETAGFLPIKSPMVGTFYSASSPDTAAFVQIGSMIDEETDVCIIEAMKVFNNIKAECSGTIAKILVENGETVEFGQVLFLVKP